jgi:hypothetical protein
MISRPFSCWFSLPQRAGAKGYIRPLHVTGIWSAIFGFIFDQPWPGLSSACRPRIFLQYRVYRPTSAALPSCWLFLLDLLGLLVFSPSCSSVPLRSATLTNFVLRRCSLLRSSSIQGPNPLQPKLFLLYVKDSAQILLHACYSLILVSGLDFLYR